jgi:hypothetical protein
MQKVLLITIISIVFNFSVLAQEIVDAHWIYQDTLATRLIYESNYIKGESKEYRLTFKKNKFKGDSLVSEQIVSDNIGLIYVLDSLEEGYTLNYQIVKNLKAEKNQQKDASHALIENLNQKYKDKDIMIKYTTDKSGALDQVINQDKIIGIFDQMMSDIRKDQVNNMANLKKKEKEKIEQLLEVIGSGSVLYKNVFYNFISNIHALNGMIMAIDDTLAFIERMPIPGLKKAFDSDCLLFINSYDTTSNELEYVVEKYMDSESLTEMVKSILKKQIGKSELDKLKMEGFVKTQYFINPQKNWPAFIKITKEIYGTNTETGEVDTNQEVWVIDNELPDQK